MIEVAAGTAYADTAAAVVQAGRWLRLALESAGGLMIAIGVAAALIGVLGHLVRFDTSRLTSQRLVMARFLTLALEFQLAADVLDTAMSPGWQEVGELAAIAAIRTLLNISLRREIAEERRALAERKSNTRARDAGRTSLRFLLKEKTCDHCPRPLLWRRSHSALLVSTRQSSPRPGKIPTAQPIQFRKTVTVFVTKDEAMRRSVEDQLAARFTGGVPSYTIIRTIDPDNHEAILDRLRETGFDGAVIMRVVDVTTQPAYVPGSYWYATPYTFNGYWNAAWAYPYDPGYVVTDRIVSVETQVYSLAEDKLIFAARSETTNPASARKLTSSIMRHITADMKKKGLLAMHDVTAAHGTAVE